MQYRRNLDFVFPTRLDTGKPSAKYLQISLLLLGEQPCYLEWWKSETSCLLLISGTTVPEGQKHACGYSWLSPAACDLAEGFQRNQELVAFFNCHPTFEMQSHEAPKVTDVVAGLLFQILKSQPHILRHDFERRSQKMQIQAWSTLRDKDALAAMLDPAIDILQSIRNGNWTYLIIDRADRCTEKLMLLLQWLHKLVSAQGCRVKVLVIWDSKRSNIDDQDWENFEELAAGRVFSKLGWYQERRQHFDKSSLREPH